jgi:Bacterial dnaA  protein
MHRIQDINTKPNKLYCFENYFNSQRDVAELRMGMSHEFYSCIISGKQGSGVTHILNAICNKGLSKNRKVIYITGQWLIHFLKSAKSKSELKKITDYLLLFDLIAIDNIQFLHRKSQVNSQKIMDLLIQMRYSGKTIILGCSEQGKDFSRTKKFEKVFSWRRYELKELSGYDIFCGLKSLCAPEDNIPDKLLYAISAYNGTMQEHINCLISLRFNLKLRKFKDERFTFEQFNEEFELKKYFPQQQFRRTYIQSQMMFKEKAVSAKIFSVK